jgi:hypothetical protein
MSEKDFIKNLSSEAIGTSIGLIVGGPVGAAVGAVIGPVSSEVLGRFLTKKEKERINSALSNALLKIKKDIDSGRKVREDLEKSQIEELIEGTLLKAGQTYQKKKEVFLSNLLSNSLFINKPIENLLQILSMIDRLSYRQLCIISVIEKQSYPNTKSNYLSSGSFKFIEVNHYDDLTGPELDNVYGVYSDICSLINDRILYQDIERLDESGDPFDGREYINNIESIVPNNLRLDYIGREIYNVLELSTINREDIKKIEIVLNY